MPECPDCGCEDFELIERREYRGAVWERSACAHCGRVVSAESEEYQSNVVPRPDPSVPSGRVIIMVVLCPKCGADWPPVAGSPLPVRWHKCNECGHSFKSVEKRPDHAPVVIERAPPTEFVEPAETDDSREPLDEYAFSPDPIEAETPAPRKRAPRKTAAKPPRKSKRKSDG